MAADAGASPDASATASAGDEDSRHIVVKGLYEHEELSGPKATAPLLDTPQTVTVISDQTIRKQNLLSLRDVLQTVPGITFGAGEGGGGYGDSINLRGYSANNDITLDGVRDSAQYSRTDPFNTQQIEVYNGANSVFNGSGSVGGTINLVSKAPKAEDLTIVEAGVGSDNYYRATIDSNQRVGDLVAVRLNAMVHRNDVPGRDVEKYRRWGVAPAVTLGIGAPTSLTLSYMHQRDDNTPIYGIPYFRNEVTAGPLPGADSSAYFGIRNLDKQKTTVDRASALFAHDFGSGISLQNLTRWQRVHQYSQTSAPQGIFCLASGVQPVTASPGDNVGAACPPGLAPGFYAPSGPRGLVRDQRNDLMFNQTTLRVESGAAGRIHNILLLGGAYSWESYGIEIASLLRNADGTVAPQPPIDIAAPDTVYTGPVNYMVTARSKGTSRNGAVYAFDTLELGRHVELNGGLRYENNHADFRAIPLAFYPQNVIPLTPAATAPQVSDENLFSWRFGLVVKPVEAVSLYASYANAKTPSSATVRLGCGTVVSSANGVYDPCAVAPETARNYEVGVKAGLMHNRLLLTAALFRNERSNYRVTSNDPSLPTSLQVLDGRSRVDGVALGATGAITPHWTIFANYTYLKSKVLQSVSDFCLAHPGPACLNSADVPDPAAGDALVQTPEHSGSLFTSYKLPFGLEVGYGFTYQGGFALNQSVLANRRQFRSDDYLTHRAYLSYAFANGLTAQLNIQNLTNAKYYTAIRNNITAATGVVSGGWATPGEARSVRFSLFYSF